MAIGTKDSIRGAVTEFWRRIGKNEARISSDVVCFMKSANDSRKEILREGRTRGITRMGPAESFHRLLLGTLLVLSLASCRRTRATAETAETAEPLRDRPAGYLLKRCEQNELRFGWLGMKLDADVLRNDENTGFKANVRIRRDSAIWISVSPALGIEVFRVLVTRDSLKYISKLPENKHYYLGRLDALSDLARVDMDFEMLQDILVGNAVGMDREQDKFRSEIDNRLYLLKSKYRRRVRRVVGVDDRRLNPNDTIVVNPSDPRYQRTIRRKDEEDLIISRYWLEPENFRLVKCVFNDLFNQRTVEIDYSDFTREEDQVYPASCSLRVKDPASEQQVSFRITRIALNKPYDLPFEIPDDFPRKENP